MNIDHPLLDRSAIEHALQRLGERLSRQGVVAELYILGGVAIVSAGVFSIVRTGLIDDSYITLDYVRNLAEHFRWGMIPGRTANTATSPLNIILIAVAAKAASVVTGSVRPVLGLGIVFVTCMVVIAGGLGRLSRTLRLSPATPILGTALILLNPFIASSTGLEVHLMAAVIVVLLMAAADGRPARFGIVAGLVLLTRLDLIIFVVVLGLAASPIRRQWMRAAAIAVVVWAPWFVFSWIELGGAIPDTFVLKTEQRSWHGYTFVNGPLFYLDDQRRAATAISFAPALAGLITLGWFGTRLFRRGGKQFDLPAALGLGGIVYYAAYSVLGVPPYQWYYAAPIIALSIVFAFAVGKLRGSRGHSAAWIIVSPTVIAAILCAATTFIDGDRPLPWRTPPIFGNWATPVDYARLGHDVRPLVDNHPTLSPPEIGTVAYFCRCTLVNVFSDQSWVIPRIEEMTAGSGVVGRIMLHANYMWLNRYRKPLLPDYRLVWTDIPQTGPDTWHLWSPVIGNAYARLVYVPTDVTR